MGEHAALQQALGYSFRDAGLLREALTHRSYGSPHNERLEFLGDSVLNCIVSVELFNRFPNNREGDLSRSRAYLVREGTLFELAQRLRVGELLRLGEGELKSGGFARASILADALEAILGAAYLDGGFEAARAVVKRLYEPILVTFDPRANPKDAKTELQEVLQGLRLPLPEYQIVTTTGAAHDQTFEVACIVEALCIRTTGRGTSRRMAEQQAASTALLAIEPAVRK